MAIDYSSMTTRIVTILNSAGTMEWTVAEVNSGITEGLKEYAKYQPHIVPLTLTIESRYGTCSTTSGTTNSLIDTTKGQFKSTDATDEKVIYNSYDRQWAVVASTTSTAQIGLTRDIFTVNENYRIYNKRCWNEKQLYIGGMPDYVEIDSVEYPIGEHRNFKILNDVLEIDVESVADSDASSSKTQLPDIDVLIRFNRPHVLTPLTDLTGKLAATVDVGATTISGSSLQAAGTLSIGDEFYIQGLRNLYTVTTAATIATTAAIAFYPPLEAALADTTTTFTFTKSSLSAQQEETFADLVAARLAVNKAPKLYMQANSALVTVALAQTALSSMGTILGTLTAVATTAKQSILSASGAAGSTWSGSATYSMTTGIAAATTAAASALALINTIPVTIGAENDYMQQATTQLNNAIGALRYMNAHIEEAKAHEGVAASYFNDISAEMNTANGYANQAVRYMNEVSTQLSVSNSGRLLEAWGRNKLAETLRRLESNTKPKSRKRYSTAL